ncbi:Hypothetical protein P9303_04471 [Prochlorococcus marinus str. MIT 9303]|uniref:Uncharacterized protein n=1 Tax=Prochlorococcus marinus (strain MIT 9303) TaxID=59922 RepID=A2C6T9_PROM3|nr:Hypothetical protein P9303_04471 [Prochlorococcus marinus str. MIT 9303]
MSAVPTTNADSLINPDSLLTQLAAKQRLRSIRPLIKLGGNLKSCRWINQWSRLDIRNPSELPPVR